MKSHTRNGLLSCRYIYSIIFLKLLFLTRKWLCSSIRFQVMTRGLLAFCTEVRLKEEKVCKKALLLLKKNCIFFYGWSNDSTVIILVIGESHVVCSNDMLVLDPELSIRFLLLDSLKVFFCSIFVVLFTHLFTTLYCSICKCYNIYKSRFQALFPNIARLDLKPGHWSTFQFIPLTERIPLYSWRLSRGLFIAVTQHC